jgi:hemolysin D
MKPTPFRPSEADLDLLSDPDAIEQRPIGGTRRAALYMLAAFIATMLAWAAIAEVDETVTARGKMVSSQRNLVIQPFDTSIIDSIDVRPGQVVSKGQLLAALDPTFAGADEAVLKGGLANLDARARRLEGELGKFGSGERGGRSRGASSARDEVLQSELRTTRDANYRAKVRAQEENLGRLEASLRTNRQDQHLLSDRVKSLSEVEQMHERLVDQNFGARKQLLEARDRRQEVERDLQTARNREQEIVREIAAARAELSAFQSDWRQRAIEELAQVQRDRDGTVEQLQKAEKRRGLVSITAPADGVVLDVPQRSIGSVVREAEVMFTIVPTDSPLEIEVQIASADVGFVKAGDPVRVKLDAFPFQKYGVLNGVVETVSRDAFTTEHLTADGAKRNTPSHYLARVRLQSGQLGRSEEPIRLLPGMTLSGEIRIARRSVISYFLYPLIGTLDSALRERR